MNCGCFLAIREMCAKVWDGMTAHNELGLFACRNRQTYSISFGGRWIAFSMSRKEDSVLTPGAEDLSWACPLICVVRAAAAIAVAGAGGGDDGILEFFASKGSFGEAAFGFGDASGNATA